MRPGLATTIQKVQISTYFESAETDLHIPENTCLIDYADTWLLKRVHWLWNSQRTKRSPTNYGYENTVEFDNRVAWASLPITRIHLQVPQESKIKRFPATLHNTEGVDHCQVCHGRLTAILVLDLMDVEKAYRYSASHDHCLQ